MSLSRARVPPTDERIAVSDSFGSQRREVPKKREMYEILLCAMQRRSLDNPDTVFSRKHTALN